jgi:hypothetical protein
MTSRVVTTITAASISVASLSLPALAANCGDTTGTRGRDVVCRCGDTVTTDTRLAKKDPVTRKICPAGGLVIAAGINLDLNRLVITGSSTGVGIKPGPGASVRDGTVQRFATGALVDRGSVALMDVALDTNSGSGLEIVPAQGETPAVNFGGLLASASDNGSSGILVATGASLVIAGESTEAKLQILRNDGIGLDVRGGLDATNVSVRESSNQGLLVDTSSLVRVVNSEFNDNGGDGIHVRGAPGASNLDDTTMDMDIEDYGFVMGGVASRIAGNGGHGIHLGDPAQTNDVSAFFDLGLVENNAGRGVLMEQKAAPGADCGASANYPGCTGATMHGLIIHDNASSGVELRTSFVIPRKIGGTRYGLGFTSNKVFHNAMGPGCAGVQTQPQVRVVGPPGQNPAVCAAAADESACENLGSDPANNHHCYWTGASCIAVWDLRGALDCDDNTANPNQIHSYNSNTDPTGASELSVGLYSSVDASSGIGANVWADNNSWRTGDEAQNVDQDAFSFVDADTICPPGGILLQCSSQ